MEIFDRDIVRGRRDRAAPGMNAHDFLAREVSDRLSERLLDFNRPFPAVLEIGGPADTLHHDEAANFGHEIRVRTDLSSRILSPFTGPCVAADEERIPFAENSFDLIAGVLSLHWVNDLPGALIQINQCLRPDGLFIAAMFGGGTLTELRQALLHAEAEVEGGASPRISPFADLRDAGALLQRAGFALPVADTETITVTYRDAFELMRDLRGMGETNAILNRRKTLSRRATFMRAAAIYHEMFADDQGRIPATFEIIWLTGWAPHPDQPKPLRPGSATTRLADAFKASP
ncbi:MAG: methyltransferase domain-containing protein [Sphingomonadales bacterium]